MPTQQLKGFITRKMSNTSGSFPADYVDDISVRLCGFEFVDSINDEVEVIRFRLASTDSVHYETRYQPKDIVEFWISDGISSSTFPSSVSDVTQDSKRAFVGEVIRIVPSLSEDGALITEILARGTGGPLHEMMCELLFLDSSLAGILDALVDEINTKRGSAMDSSTGGQYGYLLSVDSFVDYDIASYYFNEITYFDAFSRLIKQLNFNLIIDASTYHPRSAGSATNRPTITLEDRSTIGTVGFTVVEGTNLVSGKTSRTSDRTKTRVSFLGRDSYGTPIRILKEETSSVAGITNELGTDKYGHLDSFYHDEAIQDFNSLDTLADNVIELTKQTRREFEFTISPGRFIPGDRATGKLIGVTAASLGIAVEEDLEVVQSRYTWGPRGLSLTLTCVNYSPAFGRILCPALSRTRDELLSDVYAGFEIWYLCTATDHSGIDFRRSSPHVNTDESAFIVSPTISYVFEGDTHSAISAFSLSWHSAFLHWTIEYYTYLTVDYVRVRFYDGITSAMVAQGEEEYDGSSSVVVTISEYSGSGLTGTVTVASGMSTDDTDAANLLFLGLDVRSPRNSAHLMYHGNSFYLLYNRADVPYIYIAQYTLDGTYVTTKNFGAQNDATGNPGWVTEAAVLQSSSTDNPIFVVGIADGTTSNNPAYYYNLDWSTTTASTAKLMEMKLIDGTSERAIGIDGITDTLSGLLVWDQWRGSGSSRAQFAALCGGIDTGGSVLRTISSSPARYYSSDPYLTFNEDVTNGDDMKVMRGIGYDYNGGVWFKKTNLLAAGYWRLWKHELSPVAGSLNAHEYGYSGSGARSHYAVSLCIVPYRKVLIV